MRVSIDQKFLTGLTEFTGFTEPERSGDSRRQFTGLGSQGSAVALRAMAGQGGGACQESVGRGSAAGTLSRMVQP
jgi:hypothetical protein